MFDIHKFILSLLSLLYGSKLSILGVFVFTGGKKLQLKTSQMNAPIPLYTMNIMKIVSPLYQEIMKDDEFVNSMNNFELYAWTSFAEKLLRQLPGRKLQGVNGKAVEKPKGQKH